MTLEIEPYIGGNKKPMETLMVEPGESLHIPSVDSEGRDEMWIAQCRVDNKSSNVHRVYPHVIWPSPEEDPLHPRYMEYDRNESDNRARVITKRKSWTLYVRQRTNIPDKFIYGRYRFKHK